MSEKLTPVEGGSDVQLSGSPFRNLIARRGPGPLDWRSAAMSSETYSTDGFLRATGGAEFTACPPGATVGSETHTTTTEMTDADRWQALKEYLGQQIEADFAVFDEVCLDSLERRGFGGLLTANRNTLAKMRELEGTGTHA